MRYLLKLAARNLWRQKRRTFLTFLAIAVGLAALIEVDCIMRGVDRDAIDNLINLETGDLRVHAQGYFAQRESLPIDLVVEPSAVLAALGSVPGVKTATPRLVFGARLNTGWEEIPVVGVGIDPELDPQVFTLAEYVEGKWLSRGAAEALVGYNLAQVLELEPGDIFTLVTRTRGEAFQAVDLTVTGLIRSPHPQVNSGQVYLPLDVADQALAVGGGATEVVLRIERRANIDEVSGLVRASLQGAGIPAEVLTWRETARDFLAISQSKQGFTGLLIFMILIIAVVGMVNTILLGAMERVREIGMMKAMGMSPREIVLLFMFEATGIGVLGSITGCLVGIAGNAYLVNHGIDVLRAYQGLDIGYPIAGVLRGAWNWPMIVETFFLGVVVSWVASYVPARRVAAQDPLVSLRHG
ncbi:MAG: ABC transporter permease [Firmicutes bacterium]|jgi:putative ABC transport system permease protein|nr:ABC transporter permease [Bacillota bacterium]MDH7496549.1 ABC transporter permease [Bacillota bacterium]